MTEAEREQVKDFIQYVKSLSKTEQTGLLMMTEGLRIIAENKKTAN